MNTNRIALMVKMLEEVQAGTWKGIKVKKLDLDHNISNKNIKDVFNLQHWTAKNYNSPCGYSACAVGHAGLDKRFRKLGFKSDSYGIPKFEDESSRLAVITFFDISCDLLDRLYVESYYPQNFSAKKILEQVIRRHKLLLEIGEEQFMKKFTDSYDYETCKTFSQHRLVSKNGRVYNARKEGF